MSTRIDRHSVSRDDDIDIAKLTVKTKFIHWQRDFRIVACSKDYWNLYTGREQLLTKPDRHIYMMSRRVQDLDLMSRRVQDLDQETKHTYTVSTLIEEFRLDLEMYDKQAKRAREATLFLYKILDATLRNILSSSFLGSPDEAFSAVSAHFNVSGPQGVLQLAHGAIVRVRLSDFVTVSEYYNELLLCIKDFEDLGGAYSDEQFKTQLLAGLPLHYAGFVQTNSAEQIWVSATAKDIFLRLLSAEAKKNASYYIK